ncbi:HPr family phosphocarrier protein [Paratractidigestivibacter sp.]|uniref:HPr family phosphocarrier protein n=1 Tax=Paratractidigestivibacter sp. TaxID=2847316 RepID=UPI003AB584F7
MREIVRQITDPLGFHIQLAVLLAGEAQRWRSRVTFMHEGRAADASDLMALLSMGVRTGEAVVVRIEGVDEGTAAEAIDRLARTW